jgi:serine protein kinase
MPRGKAIVNALRQELNLSDYRKKHGEGSFDEYLDIGRAHPEVMRTAYQRLYDMILSHGAEEVYENKERIARYKFFHRVCLPARRRDLRPRPAAQAPGQLLQVGRS